MAVALAMPLLVKSRRRRTQGAETGITAAKTPDPQHAILFHLNLTG
jgi:hypothetical protein